MFETLDVTVFATAETAYGPADDVLAQLHQLADPDFDVAESALDSLAAGLYHQDQFCLATKLLIPFVLEVLTLDLPIRTEITRFLASMMPHARVRGFATHGHVAPLHIHGLATVAEIGRGRVVIATLLDAQTATLRGAAAWLLAGLLPVDPAPLVRRLAIESDDDVRVALHLALAAMGHPAIAEPSVDARAADVARVLAAQCPLDDERAAAFARLLAAPSWADLDFENGLPCRVAARQLLRLGRDEPRVFDLLREAWHVHQALPPIASPHEYICVHQTTDEFERRRATASFDSSRHVLDAMLVWAAFEHDTRGEPQVDYVNLDARQRWTLENVEIIPRRFAAQLARLHGDFVLDHVVTVGDQAATIETHLSTAGKDDAAHDVLVAALVAQLSADRMFEFAMTVMNANLAGYLPAAQRAVMRGATACITDARVLAWLANHDAVTYSQGEFALHAYRDVEPKREPPLQFERLVIVDLQQSRPDEKAWVATFPSPRRERLLVQIYCTFWQRVPGLYDPALLVEALLDAFIAPTCQWRDEVAIEALEIVPLEQLLARCANVTDGQARVLAAIIARRQPRAHFTLTFTGQAGAFRLALARDRGPDVVVVEVPSVTAPGALRLVVAELRLHPRAIVTIAGSVAAADAYRLQLQLGDQASPIEVKGLDGTVLRAGI